MCITLTVEESDPDFQTCWFVETDPLPDTEVERGSTVTIVAGTQPCEDEQTPPVGAPIKIPSLASAQGLPLTEVLATITESVREQCGGDECVTLTVQESDPDFQTCQFVTTDPPPDTEVERGGTVTIVAGSQPCEGG